MLKSNSDQQQIEQAYSGDAGKNAHATDYEYCTENFSQRC